MIKKEMIIDILKSYQGRYREDDDTVSIIPWIELEKFDSIADKILVEVVRAKSDSSNVLSRAGNGGEAGLQDGEGYYCNAYGCNWYNSGSAVCGNCIYDSRSGRKDNFRKKAG